MKRLSEAGFVTCVRNGAWKGMSSEELEKEAGDFLSLLAEELEKQAGYAGKQVFLQEVRNRLDLLLASPRTIGDSEKKCVPFAGARAGPAERGGGQGRMGTGAGRLSGAV